MEQVARGCVDDCEFCMIGLCPTDKVLEARDALGAHDNIVVFKNKAPWNVSIHNALARLPVG